MAGYVGVGSKLPIVAEFGVTVTGATLTLRLVKPSGLVERSMTPDGTKGRYTTTAADTADPGAYQVQAKYVLAGVEVFSAIATFQVRPLAGS
jgi:hypothetical protein